MRQHNEPGQDNKRFGQYLRRVREARNFSLDAVEEMSGGYPSRVTKSHLSRIENGQAVPTFPRMFTLSQIYGVPVASMADRFEIELKRAMSPVGYTARSEEELSQEAYDLRIAGRYPEALLVVEDLLDRRTGKGIKQDEQYHRLRLDRIECLYHLGRYSLAKEECEELLNVAALPKTLSVLTLQYFVICCFRLGRFTVAVMGLEQAARELVAAKVPDRLRADLEAIRGNVCSAMGRYAEAKQAYGTAVEWYEKLSVPFEACRTRVNITSALIALGETSLARVALNKALSEAEAGGYDRQRALALSNLALLTFQLGDLSAAETYCIRSNAIARPREFVSVVFRNCYYLWKIAGQRGDEALVKANERTLKTYLGRVEEPLPELEAYRAHLSGEES